MSSVSRREFVLTGSALLVGSTLPGWAEIFPQGQSVDALRAEVADAALKQATAAGASYADIRVNRYRRESIATRERQVQNVSRSTSYGLGIRVLVDGGWGFAATNRVEPAAARAAADKAVAIARTAGDSQGCPGRIRQGRHHLDERVQTRSVRRAARAEDGLPDEAE